MNQRNLTITLNTIAHNVVTRYPTINRGGCGVFALLISEHLQKLGCDVRIRILDTVCSVLNAKDNNTDVVNFNGFRNLADINTFLDICFYHIVVQYRIPGKSWRFYDTNGVNRKSAYTKGFLTFHPKWTTVDVLRTITQRRSGWNSCYDRRKTPAIRNQINAAFQQLTATQEGHHHVDCNTD